MRSGRWPAHAAKGAEARLAVVGDGRHRPLARQVSRARSSSRFRNTRPGFWPLPRSAGTIVDIVLALAGAEPQPLRQRRALRLQFGVGVKRGLVRIAGVASGLPSPAMTPFHIRRITSRLRAVSAVRRALAD